MMPDKKKFLFVSVEASINDVAWHVQQEGHEVKYFIEEAAQKEVADGFVPKTDDWAKEVAWADVVVFDDTRGMGAKAKKLRQEGKPVVGGTPYTDKLEDDRAFGQEELKNAGVQTIPHWDFSSFDDAIAFVKEHPEKYVLKPSGEAQKIKHLLFVGEEDDGNDMGRVLEEYKKTWSKKIKSFQLQRRASGVEVAVGAFFNGKEFICPINVNFEHKKLFPGDIGPSTGEMGTSMFWSMPNKMFNLTLKKMEPKLKEEGYVGYVDINCIANSNGVYPLEFTPRFGYPTISIQQEGMLTPIGDFLFDLAKGNTPKLRTRSGFQVGVMIVVPPFPFKDKDTFEVYSKDAVITFKKPNRDGVHIEDVKLVEGEWMVTGNAGGALIVTGTGTTMRQAKNQAYSRINNIIIPNMYYRTDISDRWEEDSDRLHSWGYLSEA